MTEDVLAEPLPLHRYLQPILGQVPEPRDWRSGPRWWWGGALDVEGLALGAMGALIAALDALAPSPEGQRRASTSSELLAASFDSVRHLLIDGKAPDVWAPTSGFRPTADGWVRLHANYPHHAARLLAGLGIADPSQLDAALRERSALDVEADVRRAGGVAAAVRSPEEWSSSPMGQTAASQPWMDVVVAEEVAKPPLEVAGGLPLSGVRVLDLTRVIAGPSATPSSGPSAPMSSASTRPSTRSCSTPIWTPTSPSAAPSSTSPTATSSRGCANSPGRPTSSSSAIARPPSPASG